MGLLDRLLGRQPSDLPRLPEARPGTAASFEPESAFEAALQGHALGARSRTDLLAALPGARLSLPSLMDPVEVESSDRIAPLLAAAPFGPVVVAYTAASRVPPQGLDGRAPRSGVEADASWVLSLVPAGFGLVLNPGWAVGLALRAADVVSLRSGGEARPSTGRGD